MASKKKAAPKKAAEAKKKAAAAKKRQLARIARAIVELEHVKHHATGVIRTWRGIVDSTWFGDDATLMYEDARWKKSAEDYEGTLVAKWQRLAKTLEVLAKEASK